MNDREGEEKPNWGTLRPIVPGEEGFEEEDADNRQFSGDKKPTAEQEAAVNYIVPRLVNREKRITRLAGAAGVGKSMVAGIVSQQLVREHKLRVAFCAPTGKAATVLRRSLASRGLEKEQCSTVHRLLYRPVTGADGTVEKWEPKDSLDVDVIICDEASMLSKDMLADMMSFNVPIFLLGDNNQLPPVGEDVGIMEGASCVLKEIHRQALDNPILVAATLVRLGGDWMQYLRDVAKVDKRIRVLPKDGYMDFLWENFQKLPTSPFSDDPLIIVRTNDSRQRLNAAARLCFPGSDKNVLMPGERIIMVRNAYLDGALVANGQRGKVRAQAWARNQNHTAAHVLFPDERMAIEGAIMNKHQFGRSKAFSSLKDIPGSPFHWDQVGMLVDYGYALTCHRAQGTQCRHGIVFLDRGMMKPEEYRRWCYTAFTRPTEELTVVG